MVCIKCARGFPEECNNPEGQCVAADTTTPVASSESKGTRWYKDETELKDIKSSGRKRAAVLYPLDKEAPCEWQKLKKAGGGKHSIIGCLDGKQVARHHGPDKNTTSNEPGNVHRICATCHNRWHTLNDPDYFPDDPDFGLHDGETIATDEEIVNNELVTWSGRKLNVFFD